MLSPRLPKLVDDFLDLLRELFWEIWLRFRRTLEPKNGF